MKGQLDSLKESMAAAESSLDQAAQATIKSNIDALLVNAAEYAKVIADKDIGPLRMPSVISAAASGLSPKDIKDIAVALRVSQKDRGILLPAGTFENLSRGKGWCRLGRGSNVTWADRVDGAYLANSAGTWVVGSNDGFSRKDQVEWKVMKIGAFWIAN